MKKDKIHSCQDCIFARHNLKLLIKVIMPGRKDQRNRELKRAAQSYLIPYVETNRYFQKIKVVRRIGRTICK